MKISQTARRATMAVLLALASAGITQPTLGNWTYTTGSPITITDGDWTLRVTGTAEITITAVEVSGSKGLVDLTLPVSNGGSIVSVGGFGNATAGNANTAVREVRLPQSLRTIAGNAFYNCTSLTNVVPFLPGTVTSVGDSAFRGVPFQGHLVLTNASAITLGNNTFLGSGIRSALLGEGVLTIRNNMFQDCVSLGSVVMSEKLTSIGGNAFQNCVSLTNVVPFLPGTVTSVGSYAFQKVPCAGDLVLTNAGMATVSNGAFEGAGLRSVTFGDGFQTLSASAFQNCKSLTKVIPFLPASIKTIGQSAFNGAPVAGLLEIGSGTNAVTLANNSFTGTAVETVVLGKGITDLKQNLFSNCAKLKQFYFCGDLPVYTTPFASIAAYQIRFYIPKHNASWENFAASGNVQAPTPAEDANFLAAYPGEKPLFGTWQPGGGNRQWYCLWVTPDEAMKRTLFFIR